MNAFGWFRRRGMAPTGPTARQLEADLAREVLAARQQDVDAALARLNAAINDTPYIPTRPGSDRNALAECNRIWARGTWKETGR